MAVSAGVVPAYAQVARVSVGQGGQQATLASEWPSISADGRYVAFESDAPNLVSAAAAGGADTNATRDVFLHDRLTATTWRISLGPGPTTATYVQGNGASTDPQVSADARYTAFVSAASNLVPGDTNGLRDVFVHDRQTGRTSRVSVSTSGAQGNGESTEPTISGDGRYVAFVSSSTNLVINDINGRNDIFIHDRQTGATTRIGNMTGGPNNNASAPAISADGTRIAFASAATNYVAPDANGVADIFVYERASGAVTRVTRSAIGGLSNGASGSPAISATGRYVAFHSSATNLVPGDTNGTSDVFLADAQFLTTQRVSVVDDGTQIAGDSGGAAISSDGRFVAFATIGRLQFRDTNALFDVYRYDVVTTEVARVSTSIHGGATTGLSTMTAMSADGRVVAFASDAPTLVDGDTNAQRDVYAHDLELYRTLRIAEVDGIRANGHSTAPSLDDDGAVMAFVSAASNLVMGDVNGINDVFVSASGSPSNTLVSRGVGGAPANGASLTPAVSGDGRVVAFASAANNLVAGDTNGLIDVFVFDRATERITRVSVSSSGGQANGTSSRPSIDRRGRFVTFESQASNLVPGDTNARNDVFVHDRQTGTTRRISIGQGRPEADGDSYDAEMSGDGRFAVFTSLATNLVAGDTNGVSDVFVVHIESGLIERASVSMTGAQALLASVEGTISDDGRYVAFTTYDQGLVPGDTVASADIVVYDRTDRSRTLRASRRLGGPQPSSDCRTPAISGDGRYVYFTSTATNLVVGDGNTSSDIFRFDRLSSELRRASLSHSGDNELAFGGGSPSPSFDGLSVAFTSDSPYVVPRDDQHTDVYLRQLSMGITAIHPAAALTAGGTLITLRGRGLHGARVLVDAEAVDVVSESDRVFTFRAPPHGPGTADVLAFFPGLGAVRYTSALTYLAPGGDVDGDGMPDADEIAYGLDPTCVDDADEDDDGDGIRNRDEVAARTHPRGFVTRYLAEGATGPFFTTELALLNATNEPAAVQLSFLRSDGQRVIHRRSIPPTTRHTLDVATIAGLESAEFSTVLESDVAVVMDRTLTWDDSAYGRHTESAPSAPSRRWYLAEGATHSGLELFYLLQNPNDVNAAVVVSFLRPAPLAPINKTYTVPARSRFNVWVNLADAGLAATDVSAEITSSHPIMVERALYRTTQGRTFNAGHESAAVADPALAWYLAEGATGAYFDLFVLLANPQATPANVRATFLKPDGSTVVRTYTVAPRSRFNIWVDTVDPALADTAVSTTIEVVNNVPIIVERALWWPGTAATWAEAHNSAGATRTASEWAMASGEDGGSRNNETYVLVANTSNESVGVVATLFFEDGTTSFRLYTIPATSRFNISVRDEFPAAVGRRFGVVVAAPDSPGTIIVEQAIYNDAGGVHWAAGSNALATIVR